VQENYIIHELHQFCKSQEEASRCVHPPDNAGGGEYTLAKKCLDIGEEDLKQAYIQGNPFG
jgi:hypothetical protein